MPSFKPALIRFSSALILGCTLAGVLSAQEPAYLNPVLEVNSLFSAQSPIPVYGRTAVALVKELE